MDNLGLHPEGDRELQHGQAGVQLQDVLPDVPAADPPVPRQGPDHVAGAAHLPESHEGPRAQCQVHHR